MTPTDATIARLMRQMEDEVRRRLIAGVQKGKSLPALERDLESLYEEIDPTQRLRELLEQEMQRAIAETTEFLKDQFITGRTDINREGLVTLANTVLDGWSRKKAETDRRAIEVMAQAIRSDLPIREITNRLASALGSGRHDMETLALTGVQMVNRQAMLDGAAAAGIDRLRYGGGPGERPFCQARVGNIYTRQEIAGMNNGQGLSVATSCGGYRCKHRWIPVLGPVSQGARKSGGTDPSTVDTRVPAYAKKSNTVPVGRSPREVIEFQTQGESRKAVMRAFDAIEAVHGISGLEKVKIPLQDVFSPMYHGEYIARWSTGLQGKNRIKITGASDRKTMATVHEFGHFLDDHVFGWFENTWRDRGFGSDKEKRLKQWRTAVNASEAIKAIKKIKRNDERVMVVGPDGKKHAVYENTTYLLEPTEIFARSYAQYIAFKSGDEQLIREIRTEMAPKIRASPYWQWDDDDFKPIFEAFDTLFTDMGWIK